MNVNGSLSKILSFHRVFFSPVKREALSDTRGSRGLDTISENQAYFIVK